MINSLKLLVVGAIAALATFGIAGSAQATLITFDFFGGGPNGTSISITESGVTLEAFGSDTNVAAIIRWGTNGLGVEGNSSTQINNDAIAGLEEIGFLLPGDSTWVSAEIWQLTDDESGGACGSTAVFDNCTTGFFTFNGITSTNPQTISLLGFSDSDVASIFSQACCDTGGFRIKSITIDKVPEPTALLLVAIGLLGLASVGAMTRRRKKLA